MQAGGARTAETLRQRGERGSAPWCTERRLQVRVQDGTGGEAPLSKETGFPHRPKGETPATKRKRSLTF